MEKLENIHLTEWDEDELVESVEDQEYDYELNFVDFDLWDERGTVNAGFELTKYASVEVTVYGPLVPEKETPKKFGAYIGDDPDDDKVYGLFFRKSYEVDDENCIVTYTFEGDVI